MSEDTSSHTFEVLPGNPGVDTHGHLTFEDEDGEEWLEPFDLPELVANMLRELGHETILHEGGWLELSGSGLHVLPQLIEFEVRENGLIRTLTSIQGNHPRWLPQGLFEYQHGIDQTFDEAVSMGFYRWAHTDLPVLLDATSAKAPACKTKSVEVPAEEGRPARKRRLLFGPIEHLGRPRDDAEAEATDETDVEDTDLCPCCLFTKSIEAFEPLLRSDQTYGLRLFASHNPADGECRADCRVNGEDWQAAVDSLRAYAANWSMGEEIKYRKQYVIVQNAPEHTTPL